jgi:HSP20 family molecular chaperone IbpA
VTAEYAKGVLTVHVPKTTLETPRKIPITKA